jgi:hypothetical protein
MRLDYLLGAIALEAAYQTMLQHGARWTRERFFEEGEKIVRKARIRRGE